MPPRDRKRATNFALRCAAALLFALLPCAPAAAAPFDDLLNSLQPTADVNDFAGILSPQERDALEQRCRQLRERSGAQLAVVVLRSLQGGEIDDFTVKLFQKWGVGQAGQNNGVMLLVALEDRKARIEVGYGLEPILPDALAGRILQQQLFPAFKQQQYAAGLTAAVNRIAEIVERNEPAPADVPDPNRAPLAAVICFCLFITVWVSPPSIGLGHSLRTKKAIPALVLLIFPGFAMLFANGAGMPWFTQVWIAVCTIAAATFGYNLKPTFTWSGGGGSGTGTGWDWSAGGGGGSWSGGGFSGGSSGGSWGGFSGGSSGGGGASGGW
jgi:uncharacterized protein